jgi:hypothetical protein
MNVRVGAIVLVFLLVSVTGVQGGVYHVSPGGNDSNNGTSLSSAWLTLAKANAIVVAGDEVIVHEGQYTGGVQPRNSGQAGSPITYRVAPGEHAVLNAAIGVQLGASHSYIVVDGFEVRASYRMAELIGSSHITIRNCSFYGGRGNYSAFSLDGASYCVIQNNYLDRQDPDGSSRIGDEPTGGDGLRLIGTSNHNLIEGNTATRCEHIAFASSFSMPDAYQSYNIWRNNTSYKNHTNFSLQDGVQRCVFENNTGYYPGLVWTGGNGWCLQFTGTNCIIRFNTLYDDTATVYVARQWPGIVGTMSGSANGNRPSLLYNKVYNNTIYGENDQKEWQKEGWRFDNHDSLLIQNNNVMKNNIIAGAPYVQVDDIDVFHSFASMNNRYEANLLSGANGQPALVRYESSTNIGNWSLADIERLKPDQWAASNKEGDPQFVNTTGQGSAKDFTLRSGSPAIDAGVHLTTATNAGNGGTTLVVEDAGYFIDGWGVPGVYGDSIKIEAGQPVGINTIDYGTNTITLNAPRTWGQGARVFYYRSDRFQGIAPDIGAHELGGQTPPPPPSRPATPLLLYPDNGGGSLNTSATLRWSSDGSASSYQVQVSRNADLSTRDVDVTTSDEFLILSSLNPATTYYWRVRGSNTAGTSDWSEVWSFSTGDPQNPPANILTNPKFDDGLTSWWSYTNGRAEFTVSSPGYGSEHAGRLHIDATGDNTQVFQYNIVLEPSTRYVLSFAARSTSGHDLDVSLAKHSPPFTSYGLTSWRCDLDTAWKVFTTEFVTTNFTTPVDDARLRFWFAPYASAGDEYYIDDIVLAQSSSALSSPTLVAPPRGAVDQPMDVTLRWQPIIGASAYAVEVASDSSFASRVALDTAVVDTQYHLTGLGPLTTYYWRVRSRNSIGASGFSPASMFTTGAGILAAPHLLPLPGPIDQQPVSITMTWHPSTGAAHYHFQLATDIQFNGLVRNDTALTDTVVRIGPLSYGTTYYARVRAINTVAASAFSSPYGFTTIVAAPPAPHGLVLMSQPQASSVTLSWPPVPGALTYHLQLSADSLFGSLVFNDSSLVDTAKTIASLRPSTPYFARVRAKGPGGVGEFSSTLAFTTAESQTSSNMPRDYLLEQNFPNPFNPSTKIRYEIPANVHVRIALYNSLGQQVKVLIDSEQAAGRYELELTSQTLASGVYFYVFEAGAYIQTRKLIILK